MLKVSYATTRNTKNKALAVFAVQGEGDKVLLGEEGKKLDRQLSGILARGLNATPSFKGKKSQTLLLRAPTKSGPSMIALIGLGALSEMDALAYEQAGAAAYGAFAKDAEGEAALIIDVFKGCACIDPAQAAIACGLGAQLRSYRFDKYQTKSKEPATKLNAVVCVTAEAASAKKASKKSLGEAEGVFLARDLVSEPANVMDPAAMAQAAKALAQHGVKVEILARAQLEKLGMRALLGVSQGSEKPPFFAIMTWDGAKDQKPLALVGKGVTFDTGGISLKPGANMGDMKYDMAGAAAVIGTMKTLAMRKAKAHVIGVVGLVENMPSGKAQRPGDVIKSASGQTIEVLNTDAEGRLVLADALWYVQKKLKPSAIIDLATLTGAIKVALGEKYAGLFSNNDDLVDKLLSSGKAVDELLWRMPLHKDFDKLIDSPIADMKNIGGPNAGSSTAAQFLQRFVKDNMAWAHLDIAGMAWATKDQALCPKGAAGYGVRLLNRLVLDHYER